MILTTTKQAYFISSRLSLGPPPHQKNKQNKKRNKQTKTKQKIWVFSLSVSFLSFKFRTKGANMNYEQTLKLHSYFTCIHTALLRVYRIIFISSTQHNAPQVH